jgi:general secretion pathway protein B
MSYILDALKKLEQRREQEELHGLFGFSKEGVTEQRKNTLWPYLLAGALMLNAGLTAWWIMQPSRGQSAASRQEAQSGNGERLHVRATGQADVTAEQARKDSQARLTASVVAPGPVSAATERPSPGRKIYALSELPASVKAALPEFTVTGHAFSTQAETRVVRLNDKILQEGQELAPGLKVDEIVPDGIVMTYQGYRFRLGNSASR